METGPRDAIPLEDGRASAALASGDGADYKERLCAARDRIRQRRVRRLVREIAFAREKPHERTPALRRVVAHRSSQHRKARFDCIEDGPLRRHAVDLYLELAADSRERA